MDPQDQQVRLKVYELLLRSGVMPKISLLSAELDRDDESIRSSLERLYAAKALALMPESGEILMASPWSAVPTPFLVEAGGRSWWANCGWDALAIPAAMGTRGLVTTSCACCGEAMQIAVHNRELESGRGVLHIAQPAKFWWNDIFFT